MVEKDIVIKEKVKYSGYGDLKTIYGYAHDWLKGEQFTVVEENYTEKVKSAGKDIDILWRASKKITDYFKIDLDIKWKILLMEEVEVEVDGKKKKMNKFGEIAIETKGLLIKDYTNQWNKSAATKFFKELYNKYVIPARTEKMKTQVEEIVQTFKEEMKAIMELTGKK